MKLIALTVDCEQFGKENTEFSKEGNIALLKVLQEANAKATFFVTGYFAEKEPEQVKEIHALGHEIASHGYCHSYRNNQELDLKQDILLSKKILNKTIGGKIAGFRSPQMQYSDLLLKTIGEAGFKYDSSLHPAIVPGFYWNFNKPLKPFYPLKDKKVCRRPFSQGFCNSKRLLEVPVAAMPLLRLPVNWYWMRNFGAWWPGLACRALLLRKINPVIYFHSWECTAVQCKGKMPGYTRNTGKKFCNVLRKFLRNFKEQEFVTVSELLRSAKL
jgi:hypothetical protein